MSLYFVFLRKPKDLNDRRNDPFWEFGNFGRTGCHRSNLLHPRLTPLRDGDRLAFLQGGMNEIRIVALTPPITVSGTAGWIELEWNSRYRPLPYEQAPVLISNSGESEFRDALSALNLESVNRRTLCGAAASRLRSRKIAIDPILSKAIVRYFSAANLPTIASYPEAIQLKDEVWHAHAVGQGWAGKAERLREFKRIGLQNNLPATSVASTAARPLKLKARC